MAGVGVLFSAGGDVLGSRTYYSARAPPPSFEGAPDLVSRASDPHVGQGSVAGAGAALLFKGQFQDVPETSRASTTGTGVSSTVTESPTFSKSNPNFFNQSAINSIRRFLSPSYPRICVFGGSRFDPNQKPDQEWEQFGTYYFALPLVEVRGGPNGSFAAVTIAWEDGAPAPVESSVEEGMTLLDLMFEQ